MDIEFEAKVCHIGLSIGFFSKDHIIVWADKVIDLLEVTLIPDRVFDLSMVKKEVDIPRLLIELCTNTDEEAALKTIVGMINLSYKNKYYTLYETCEILYRLSNYVDYDHEWKGYLYAITGNLERALDGYGDVDTSRVEIEEFLLEHEKYSQLFDLNLLPIHPLIIEFKPRKELILLDVSHVVAPADLHMILKCQLDLPDVYGMNWNAFWDAITGMVKLPMKLTITGWGVLEERLPKEANSLKKLLKDYSLRYPNENFTVEYEQKSETASN
ncbi:MULTISPECIES: barstar family protein [Bacillales]|uniref:barstar family protein n=1 Tax=Bacillales TaxID=1385 RepID=UPI00034B2C01|nr:MULTISPECIES: barstar family protein [Bacillales]